MIADLLVNYYTTSRFMQFKSVNADLYHAYLHSRMDMSKLEEHMFVVVNPAPATVPMSDAMEVHAQVAQDSDLENAHTHYKVSKESREGEEMGLLCS
jgi:hypothetical protein